MNSETIDGLAERIRRCAAMAGNGDLLAQKTAIPRRTLETYLTGQAEPKASRLVAIAKAAGANVEWLATGEGEPEGNAQQMQAQTQGLAVRAPALDGIEDRFALVPLYDVRVSAGHGAFNGTENVLTQLAFTRYWLNKLGLHAAHLVAVRVDGDSMEPTIRSGDVLLIDREQTHPRDGAIYVMRREDWLVAKRLQLLAGGLVRVISDNQAYPPEEVEPAALEILGRAVWKGGPL